MFQQEALAFRRQFRIDGEISRARKMNSQDGDDLLPALLHHDGDKFVRLAPGSAAIPVRSGKRNGRPRVGETPLGRADGQLFGTFRHLLEKGSVQQIAGQWRCGTVGGVAQGDLRRRDQPPRIFRQRSLPGGIVRGQILQQALVRSKHIVQETSGEKFLHRVPIDDKFSGGFLDHIIQAHLRRLTHGVNRFPQAANPGRLFTAVSQVQETCEYHGHDRFWAHALKS